MHHRCPPVHASVLSSSPSVLWESRQAAGRWPHARTTERATLPFSCSSRRVGECLECVSGELDFFTLPNCWEHFGFDLLVDASWHVWLLEANAEPDFRQALLLGADSSAILGLPACSCPLTSHPPCAPVTLG